MGIAIICSFLPNIEQLIRRSRVGKARWGYATVVESHSVPSRLICPRIPYISVPLNDGIPIHPEAH